MTREDLPPVILLGIDTPIGLSVVRELGRQGIEVHGIARDERALGSYSRFLHRSYCRPAGAAALVDQINRIAAESGARFLMTVSMGDALAMRAAADRGDFPQLCVLLPSLAKLQLVNDKAAICRIAAGLGIEVPATWEPDAASAEAIPGDLSYPCVLKWRDPELMADPLDRLGLPVLKTEFAHDPAGLAQALARYRPLGAYPLVQSYAKGTGLGQMFVIKDGEALLRFQHRRLHEWPPEGGTSTLCESVSLDQHGTLRDKSEALLREIGWEGPAMVEYRWDEASGRAVLMEINGRFWGSLPLAYHAGAPFALATYYALGLGIAAPQARAYRSGVRCRYMIPETRRLLAVTLRRSRIADRSLRFSPWREVLAYAAGFVRVPVRYYVFALNDPLPFFADMTFAAREAVRAVIGRVSPKARHSRESGNTVEWPRKEEAEYPQPRV